MLTVLCGIPASGKTSWRIRRRPSDAIICPDDIREELTGDASCQDRNALVFLIATLRTRRALAAGHDVTVDATNTTRGERRRWLGIAAEYGTECVCVWIDCPVSHALQSNEGRDRQVPEEVIRAMADRFTPPSVEEGFAQVTRVCALEQDADGPP